MPIFNVLEINEKHIAKVMSVRAERDNVAETISLENTVNHKDFQRWQNYVRKQSKGTLTSITVKRIFN